MIDDKDPFRTAEAQAKQQQDERETGNAGEHAQQQQQPTTADFEQYDEEVGDKVEGIGGASAGGPAV
jgi:hypothetical protein